MPGLSESSLTLRMMIAWSAACCASLRHHHRPAGVERGVEIVVAAMHVERVFGQRAGADLEDHRREFSRRVVVLLHRVNDALAGGEIDGAAARDGVGGGATLRGVFAFGFDGDFLLAPDVEFTLSEGPLVNLAAFGRRRDRIKHAAFGDSRLDVLRDELVAVARDRTPGYFGAEVRLEVRGGYGRSVFFDRTACYDLVGHNER